MAKVSPVSIKYLVKLKFEVQGAVEKPDVIGALFGQTEGLLGSDLEMRELQKEGKIGRIEVELESEDGKTSGTIEVPTALDKSETTLIAAALETIDRIGPTDAKIEVLSIEDVRGNKRDYIIDRAKSLLERLEGGSASSKEISETVKSSMRTGKIQDYGDEKLPAGDLSGKEVIVVEGRADVVNLLKNNVNNVIGMNGTKLPREIAKLGEEKELTLFVDGDRGGKLIAKNVIENAKVTYVATAPDGKEVEELMGKEILICLRQKVTAGEFLKRSNGFNGSQNSNGYERRNFDRAERFEKVERKVDEEIRELTQEQKDRLNVISKEVDGSKKAYLLDNELNVVRKVGIISLGASLSRSEVPVNTVILDGAASSGIIRTVEEYNVKHLMAKNFASVETKIDLISF